MKKIIFTSFLLFLATNLFSQETINRSNPSVAAFTTLPVLAPQATNFNEIFRFASGNVTQLDLGNTFNFDTTSWFSLGRVNTGAAAGGTGNTAYGLRFQLPNRALLFGYQNVNASSPNPRLEWVGESGAGDLEFRFATSFTNATSTVAAKFKGNGTNIFGISDSNFYDNGRVGISYGSTKNVGLFVEPIEPTSPINNLLSPFIPSNFNLLTGISNNIINIAAKQSLGYSSKITGAKSSTNFSSTSNGLVESRGFINKATDASVENVSLRGTVNRSGSSVN